MLVQQLSIGEVKALLDMLDLSEATITADIPTWVSKEGKEDIIGSLFLLCIYFIL